MDIQLTYQNKYITFDGVQSYEDLLQEIQLKYPLLINIELSYQDEEGDIIQVSNTSDIIAITDFNKVILQMEAQIDQQKVQELERVQKMQELKQKQIEEQKRKQLEDIQNQIKKIQEIIHQKNLIVYQFSQQIEELKNQCEQLRNIQSQPLSDFKQFFYCSNIFNLIKEQESKLLLLEDNKVFDNQLNSIQIEVQDIFQNLYIKRMLEHQEIYAIQLEKKQKINEIHQLIQLLEFERQETLQNLDLKQKRLQENVTKMSEVLNIPLQNDDQF